MVKPQRVLLPVMLLVCLLAGSAPAAGSPARFVSQGPYLIVSNDLNQKWMPAVAYATQRDQYLVVWESIVPPGSPSAGHHEIWGRLVGANGQFLGSQFEIFNDTYDSMNPAVAYDSQHDQYLVVWAYDSAGNSQDFDIKGRFLPAGAPTTAGLAFGIDESRENSSKPRVAYSATYDRWLLVWRTTPTSFTTDYTIVAGSIDDQGNGPPTTTVSSGQEARDFPDLAYNKAHNDFVATWDVDNGRGSVDWDVSARRLSYDLVPQGSEFAVAASTLNEQHPTVAACDQGDQYLFVWQKDMPATKDDLYGRWMTGSGVLAPGEFFVEGTTTPQQWPRVACDVAGTEYLVAWQDTYCCWLYPRVGIWAKTLHPDGTMDPAFQVIAPDLNTDYLYPAVAYGKYNVLVVWQRAPTNSSQRDIWGRMISLHSLALPLLRR